MASRREPSERLPPGYRGSAAGSQGNPSSRAPPGARGVSWEDRPTYLETPPRNLIPPGGESPPYRYNEEGHRRFGGGDSPTQLFFEGYHDSPPRRFPGGGRGRPFPHHMSPDDSPPRGFGGDPGRRHLEGPHGRFPEVRRSSEDARRRFAEGPARRYGEAPYGASQIRDEPHLRYAPPGPRPPSVGYPGYREHGVQFSDSESPSPPPGKVYLPPPRPPGIDINEPLRHGDPHQSFGRFREDDHSPPYHRDHRDEMSPPRRFGAQPRRFNEESPPSPPRRYSNDPRQRFRETPPPEFRDTSPPEYTDEPPRRFVGTPPRPQLPAPPVPVPAGGHAAPAPRIRAEDSPPREPRAAQPITRPAGRRLDESVAEHSENPPGRRLASPAFSPQHPGGLPGVYSRDPTRTESPVSSSEVPRYARPVEFSGGPHPRAGPGAPPPIRPIPGASPATHFADAPRPHPVGFGEDLAGHADSLSPPRHVEHPYGPGVAGAPLTRIPEGVTPTETTPSVDESPRAPVLGGDRPGPFVGGARYRTLREESPPGSPPRRVPADGIHRAGIAGFGDDLHGRRLGDELQRDFDRTPPPRGGFYPDASPGYNSSPGYNTPPGYLTPNYYTSSGYTTPQQFPATPPYFSQDSPAHADATSPHRGPLRTTPPQQQHESVPSSVDPSRIDGGRDAGALVRLQPHLLEAPAVGRQVRPESEDTSPLPGTLVHRPYLGSAESASPGPLGPGLHFESGGSSPGGPPVRYTGEPTTLRSPESPLPDGVFDRDTYGDFPPFASPPREQYRPPPPGLGRGSGAPLLPEDFHRPPPTLPPRTMPPPKISPPGPGMGMDRGGRFRRSPSPDFILPGLQRRVPDGYVNLGPPLPPPFRRPPAAPGHDPIFTADVMPIVLDEKLKQDTPHPGNPGSATGGGLKDLWAALAFVLHIAAITTFSFLFGFQGVTSTIRHYDAPNSYHINDWFPQLSAAAIIGAVFAFVWQTAVRIAPVRMILLTIWAGAALMALFGIVLVATGTNVGLIGLLFLFLAVCQALYSFVVHERIPFAGEMLKKVISVCGTYPSTYVVSYLFVFVALAWLGIWIFGLSGSGIRPKHVPIMVLFVASLGWTLQVLRNIVRVTVAGTVSLFYFQEGNMPPRPTYISLIRACTFSIGSICFGSLVVPLVELPCHALRRINSQAGTSEFLFSCIVCMLACFDYLIRYFNRMGYIQVAIHGKPFIRASKDTWDMLRAQEVDVLIHDDLANTILFLACGAGGSLSAIVGGVYTFIAHKSLTVVIAMISFAIGGLMTYVTMAVLESAISTYYVCFAEDPTSLQRNDGPLYERMWVRQMDLKSPDTELTI